MALKLKDPDKNFYNRKRVVNASGSVTENLSEVLSQICLGFALTYGREIRWDDLVEVEPEEIPVDVIAKRGKGRMKPNPYAGYPKLSSGKGSQGLPIIKKDWLVPILKGSLKLPSGSALGRTGMSDYARNLISWSLQKLGNLTWLSATARNMTQFQKNLNITVRGGYKVWNDKLIDQKSWSPYDAYRRTGSVIDANKWNPADVWVMNDDGEQILKNVTRARPAWGLMQINTVLINAYKSRKIIPVSLKKPKASGYSQSIMNTDEYYHRIVIGKTPDPPFEFTDGNKDMKINFTIQTVELPSGWTADQADRNPFNIPASAEIMSQQHVRLKYKTSGNQLELEMTSTSGPTYSAALGGKMGTGNVKKIIGDTHRGGIRKVKQIQRDYKDRTFTPVDRQGNPIQGSTEDFDIQDPDWYSTRQMGDSDPRKISALDGNNQELHDLFSEYVHALWVEIAKIPGNNISTPTLIKLKDKFGKGTNRPGEKGLNNARDFWYKSRAGELGLAVGGIDAKRNQRRVIQSLYDVAASIAFRTGLSKTERDLARRTGDTSFSKLKRTTTFKGGPYVKVY